MAGHAQLKFVMTECSKTQIRLTGLKYRKKSTTLASKDKLMRASFYLPFCIREQNEQQSLKELDEMLSKTSEHLDQVRRMILDATGVHDDLFTIVKNLELRWYESLHEKTCFCHMRTTKPHPLRLISAFVVRCLDSIIPLVSISEMSSLFGCAGQFVSYLVTNPKDRFSRD